MLPRATYGPRACSWTILIYLMQDQIHLYLYSCIACESQSFKRVFYLKQIFVITGAPLERRARGNCPRCPPLIRPWLQAESKCKRAFSNLTGDNHCNETGIVSSSLPVPRSTADENSNHNHLIIEEDSLTVQLTFSDGNCSSSIYLLGFSQVFASKLHAYMFVDHTVFYDIWSLKISKTKEM